MAEYAWFDLDDGRQVYRRVRQASDTRSHLPCPMLISDQTEVKSMVDGQIYTSKAALRRSYRDKGYIEVGNEEQRLPAKPKPDSKAIRSSLRKAFSKVGIGA